MTRDQIVEEVLDVFSKYTEVSRDKLVSAESLEELVDSMSRIEIMFEIEDRYSVQLSDEEVLGIRNFADVVDCVGRHVPGQAG
jgi:acyl carrier protein